MYIPRLRELEQIRRAPKPKSFEEMVSFYSQPQRSTPGLRDRFLSASGEALITLGNWLKSQNAAQAVGPTWRRSQ